MAEALASLLASVYGFSEDLRVTMHHDVYPRIDPQPHFLAQKYKGKVVLITGASRGIGRETAIQFARAGAAVVITARYQTTLDETKALILAEVPADVLVLPADVRDTRGADSVVAKAVERFGRLDALIANAGVLTPFNSLLCDKNTDDWWNTFEVNIRGVYNFARVAITELRKSQGRIMVVSSDAAQLRFPQASDYCISKHAVGRLVEYIALEYPDIKVFNLHPGTIATQMSVETGLTVPHVETLRLAAAVMLHLSSGRLDWLSGRYVSANWDFDEVEQFWKQPILDGGMLVSKLHIPR
ncbi:NAD-P-binding protein [Gloeopeniophorella convolvens]|nr:NAD-P-binding protein [Gloeopeniophorella convolvens]